MKRQDGVDKTYTGMVEPTPKYTKISLQGSGSNTEFSQVDPESDFGVLASVTVPANGSATVSVTFSVSDPVANPKDNQRVNDLLATLGGCVQY
jgi:hypothetical protein